MVLGPLPGPFDATNTKTAVVEDPFGIKVRVIERAVTINEVPLHIMVTGSLDEILSLVERVPRADADRARRGGDHAGGDVDHRGAAGAAADGTAAPRGGAGARGRGGLGIGLLSGRARAAGEEINELLRANAQIVERARNQVGNLAHGLKTPIAVLRNEAASDKKNSLARVVSSETEKMSQLVTTYLDRARLAARSAVVGKKADATHVMLRLTRVMQKLNPHVTIAMVPARCVAALVPRRRGRPRGNGGEPARQCLQVGQSPRSA